MHVTELSDREQEQLDAAAFRRLLDHLDANKDVQNIDLMILAGFCRNCLAKWWKAAADDAGVSVSDDAARRRVYKMAYGDWKARYQKPATPEQIAAMDAKAAGKPS